MRTAGGSRRRLLARARGTDARAFFNLAKFGANKVGDEACMLTWFLY